MKRLPEWVEAHGLSRRIALVLPHMLVLPAILAASDLLAELPGRAAAAMLQDGLQTFDIPLTLSPWRIEMLWNPTARRDAASADRQTRR